MKRGIDRRWIERRLEKLRPADPRVTGYEAAGRGLWPVSFPGPGSFSRGGAALPRAGRAGDSPQVFRNGALGPCDALRDRNTSRG